MEKRNLTYEQLVTECIEDVDRLYARLGGLRDAAQGAEKEFCNYGRGVLGPLRTQLSLYRDMIYENGRHDMKLGDWTGAARYKPD